MIKSITKAQQLEDLETASIKVVTDAVKGKEKDGKKAALAMKAMNTVAKHRQLIASDTKTKWSMVKSLTDRKQMRKYVESTQPEIKKLLSGK